jgi:hypothetical protein
MCACKDTDVRVSPNDSTLAGGEGQGSRGETIHPIYHESPVSSVAEHPLHCQILNLKYSGTNSDTHKRQMLTQYVYFVLVNIVV